MKRLRFPTLRIGSRGAAVKLAQHRLHDNRFGNFKPGAADGVYGKRTARASRRAKYWLGFRLRHCGGQYGDSLHHYLRHEPRPDDMRARRKRRLALRRLRRLRHFRTRAYQMAQGYIGFVERPVNHTPFGVWYGMDGQSWCAIFVSYCLSHSGRSFHYAYCPYVVSDAINGRNGLSVTHDPVRGDLTTYSWDGGVAEHIGFFDRWVDRSRGVFLAVEGNTAGPGASQTNGGGVLRQTRYTSQLVAFIRVNEVA